MTAPLLLAALAAGIASVALLKRRAETPAAAPVIEGEPPPLSEQVTAPPPPLGPAPSPHSDPLGEVVAIAKDAKIVAGAVTAVAGVAADLGFGAASAGAAAAAAAPEVAAAAAAAPEAAAALAAPTITAASIIAPLAGIGAMVAIIYFTWDDGTTRPEPMRRQALNDFIGRVQLAPGAPQLGAPPWVTNADNQAQVDAAMAYVRNGLRAAGNWATTQGLDPADRTALLRVLSGVQAPTASASGSAIHQVVR